jgi:hypothetical protein
VKVNAQKSLVGTREQARPQQIHCSVLEEYNTTMFRLKECDIGRDPLMGLRDAMQNRYFPYSKKLRMWHQEAHNEIGFSANRSYWIDQDYAIFPKRLYQAVERIDQTKRYDFCFVGAFLIDSATARNRAWIVDFITANFSDKSFLQFTDHKTKLIHKPMGDFDYTFKRSGFVPKEVEVSQREIFDGEYYKVMCASEFTLCPGGDSPWSMRFYEALMCRSIPILPDNCAFRTPKEANLGYKYFTRDDCFTFNSKWTEHNYNLFLKYHTLHPEEATLPSPMALFSPMVSPDIKSATLFSPMGSASIKSTLGRNAPCPCGSNKKFKHCHGKLV